MSAVLELEKIGQDLPNGELPKHLMPIIENCGELPEDGTDAAPKS